MLAPAIEYKDELLQLFQAQTNKVKWLTSIPSTITDLIYNTDISFSFVSINENNKVIGYFHYCFVPINENETAATNVKILNFFGGEIEFTTDLITVITEHIFNPNNNCIRLTFSCYDNNPINNFYRRFISRCGQVLWQKNGFTRY